MTSGRKPSKNKNIIKIIVTAVAAGILLFAGVHIALTNQAIRDAREFTGQTLEFLDNRVTEYKNNVTNSRALSDCWTKPSSLWRFLITTEPIRRTD